MGRRSGAVILRGVLVAVVLAAWVGCDPQRQLGPVPAAITRDQAIMRYNERVRELRPFWAKVKQWKTKFRDEEGNVRTYDGDGLKLYYHPAGAGAERGSLYLQLDNLFVKRAVVIGSNEEEFWAYFKVQESGGWGKYMHRGEDCADRLAVDPDMFLYLVGFKAIQARPNRAPYPMFEVQPEENSVRYFDMTEDGPQLLGKVTTDRRTDLPSGIAVYDLQGQVIQESRLGDYQEVGSVMVPGDILISSPSDDSYFHLKLHGFKPDDKDRAKYFTRPEKPPGIKDYRQIDQQCEEE